MSRLERLVAEVRPGVVLRPLAVNDDEAVLGLVGWQLELGNDPPR